ncbi:hypothetical protein FHU28_004956 [Micromonospora echinospora]|uniref:Uncharacterized protein n=1 Tax=Micromonospora echinospora TaxID=1877 RepID=A0ABR6MLA7_MICEC|nr:hypothetical protein [Micromonospora echinospora]
MAEHTRCDRHSHHLPSDSGAALATTRTGRPEVVGPDGRWRADAPKAISPAARPARAR